MEEMSNLERRNFKQTVLNFINKFVNVNVKRLSTFGYENSLIWISDYLNQNTHLLVIRDRDYLHLISDMKIIYSVRVLR
jgi:hypothetical protein